MIPAWADRGGCSTIGNRSPCRSGGGLSHVSARDWRFAKTKAAGWLLYTHSAPWLYTTRRPPVV